MPSPQKSDPAHNALSLSFMAPCPVLGRRKWDFIASAAKKGERPRQRQLMTFFWEAKKKTRESKEQRSGKISRPSQKMMFLPPLPPLPSSQHQALDSLPSAHTHRRRPSLFCPGGSARSGGGGKESRPIYVHTFPGGKRNRSDPRVAIRGGNW